jgi:glycosyl transferase, family 25
VHPFRDFDRVYVINLATRRDRRREMSRELERIGVAPHGKPMHWFDAIRPDGAAGFPTIGAHGCFLSHLGVLENAAVEKLERILILEDDVDFCEGFPARFERALHELREKNWSMFYGGYALQSGTLEFGEHALALASPESAIALTHIVAVRGDAIAELRDYLKRILTRQPGDPKGGPMHVDGAFSWYRREHPTRETYAHKEMLGTQRPSRTDIHDPKWFDRTRGVRTLANLARKLKR